MTALMGLDVRLRMARLYLCTDARDQQGDLADFLDAAYAGGVDIIQIRQKGLAKERELELLQLAREVAGRYQGLVCVNDSPEIAGEFSTDVLHIGQEDGTSADARRHLHPWALLGRSTHSPAQTKEAIADELVSYFCVGPVYATATKPDYAPVGLDLVRKAAVLAPPASVDAKPWFAIGGINLSNLDEVLEAGARRICVVRPITQASDPQAAAAELKDRLRQAWREDSEMQAYVLATMAGGSRG